MSQGVGIIELGTPGALAPWAATLDTLAAEARAPVFASSAWLSAWWRSLEPGARIYLLVDEQPEGVVGMLPVALLERRAHPSLPLRIPYVGLAGSGRGAADHLRPLTRSPESAARLLTAVAGLDGGRSLLLEGVTAEVRELLASTIPGRVVREVPCPRIDLTCVAGPEQLWRQKRRSNLRRTYRRCKDLGFDRRWVRLDGSNLHHLDELQRLHERLWRSRGRPGLIDDVRRVFLADVATRLDGHGSAWLQVIGDASHAVAVQLAFEFGASMCSYAVGWDPALRRLGLGVQLEAGGIERAFERGLERYDFLRGTEAHKLELGGVPTNDVSWFAPRGPHGPLLAVRESILARRDAWA